MTKASTSFAALATRLWVALMLIVSSVTVAKAADLEAMELDKVYSVSGVFASKTMTFTPEKDMTFKVFSVGSGNVRIYDSEAKTNDLSSFAYESYTDADGNEYGSRVQVSAKAGVTYYVWAECSSSVNALKFIAVSQAAGFSITKMEIDGVTVKEGAALSAAKQLNISFTLEPEVDEKSATLTCGSLSAEVELHTSSTAIIAMTNVVVKAWKEASSVKSGDKATLTITGVKDVDGNLYNGDGNITLSFIIPQDAAKLVNEDEVNEWLAAGFLSYWKASDESGILTLEFDRELMTIADGNPVAVTLVFGYKGGAEGNVNEQVDASKITIDGTKLMVDFTGKLRTVTFTDTNISFYNIAMADGSKPEFNGKNYLTLTTEFEDMTTDVSYEFTPADGSTLTSNEIELYLSNKDAISFTSFEVSYQTQDDVKKSESITSFTSMEEGAGAIAYTFSISDAALAGKNIRISLGGQETIDGREHSVSAKFNPGEELTDDLKLTYLNPSEGMVYSTPTDNNISFFFSEEATLAVYRDLIIKDLTTGRTYYEENNDFYVLSSDENAKLLNFNFEYEDGHQYTIVIPSKAVVTPKYNETEGQYGKYYTGGEFTFTFCSACKGYDFITNPLVGSSVAQLESVEFLPKSDKSSDALSANEGFTFSDGTTPSVYAILKSEYDAAATGSKTDDGTTFSTKAAAEAVIAAKAAHTATVKSKDGNGVGFDVTFANPVTEAGDYYIVFEYGTYNYGDGQDSGFNDTETVVPFTVVAGPTATDFAYTTDPSEEDEQESLSQFSVIFDDEVYMNENEDVTIHGYSMLGRTEVEGTLSFNAETHTATVTLSEEIADEGAYNFEFPEGLFGDKTWYDGSYLAGKTNNAFTVSFYVAPVVEYSIVASPANGSTVASLSEIMFYFTANDEAIEDVAAASGNVAVYKDGEKVGEVEPSANWDDEDYSHLYLYYESTGDGIYSFVFPEGVISIEGNDSPELTLSYVVSAFGYTTDPSEEDEQESLSVINVTFSNPVTFNSDKATANVSSNLPGSQTTGAITFDAASNTATITLANEITDEGRWTIQIPEGAFSLASGETSDAIYLVYYVEASSSDVTLTTDPEDGSTVESLSSIAITVNGVEFPGLGSGMVTVKKDGVEVATVELAFNPDDWDDMNLYITYSATEAGVYTFEIPEGAILDDNGDSVGQAFTLTYTIAAKTAISNISADKADNAVYDLSGRRMTQPARGLYISGGKLHLKK